ncbi:hypothetical protein BUALT_Bualt11G0115500 [Buddleja alternifolia]|uniref:Uncharacterized protein n=1 Tax=Buddleja alternifolia TaxID=168488 RepID=A0AAV6X2B6_9LAMI|nr:hypothetical protein BUALT_Bualt11G0115500 [Buddleja alternifolia]
MLPAVAMAQSPPWFAGIRLCLTVRAAAAAKQKPPPKAPNKTQRQKPTTPGFGGKRKVPVWQCVQNCGACCKLDKGPTFPSPEEIFEDPSDIQLFKSLVGPDGWCIHYDKGSRKCSIYAERPYFCRVEPEIFELLYGIDKKKFNKEACSCCIDTIKAVCGTDSIELENFNQAIWRTSSK